MFKSHVSRLAVFAAMALAAATSVPAVATPPPVAAQACNGGGSSCAPAMAATGQGAASALKAFEAQRAAVPAAPRPAPFGSHRLGQPPWVLGCFECEQARDLQARRARAGPDEVDEDGSDPGIRRRIT